MLCVERPCAGCGWDLYTIWGTKCQFPTTLNMKHVQQGHVEISLSKWYIQLVTFETVNHRLISNVDCFNIIVHL